MKDLNMNGRRHMNRTLLIAGLLLIATGIVYATDLAPYKATYEKEVDEIILAHGMKMMDLGQQYTNALSVLLETVKKAGDLDKTTAVMNESARFSDEKKMPKDPPAVLDILNLQSAFTKQASLFEADKAKRIILLSSKYDQVLESLQKSLVYSSKLDDARAVQEERKRAQEAEPLKASQLFLTTYTKKPLLSMPNAPKKQRAGVTPTAGFTSINNLRNNEKAWANRDYKWINVPDVLPVKRFAMIQGGGTQEIIASVESPGYVFIAYSAPKDNQLIKQGWKKTKHMFSYNDKEHSSMYVFEKEFQKGTLEIPNLGWAGPVLLLP